MMPEKNLSSNFASKPASPEIEHLKQILRGYELSPGKRFYEKVAGQEWLEPDLPLTAGVEREHASAKSNRLRLVSIVAMTIVAFIVITPFRDAVAQIVSRFFKVSPTEQMVVTISLTPYPTPDPEYPFNQFTLTIPVAESLAGFKVKAPRGLTGEWQFQGARYQEENKEVILFYYADTEDHYRGYMYIHQIRGDFENDWELCPNGIIEEASVVGWPAEVAHGAVWVTYDFTPGEDREWRCETGYDLSIFTIRWEEGELKYEITLNQGYRLEKLDLPVLVDDLDLIDVEELVQIAESLQ